MPTLVTIATYDQSKTACFLKEKLENEDIDCFFAVLSTNGGEWEEVRVQVKEDDVERAIRIMLRIKDEHGMDIEKIEPASIPRRILVPTDFSKGSEYACQYAMYLADKIHAEIKLLHVYPDPISDLRIKESATYLDYLESAVRENEKKAKTGILDFTYRMKAYMDLQRMGNIRIHSTLAMGNIIDNIKGISKKYNPDFIVLGTVGKREDSLSVLAGLAKSILSGLEVPVYAIPGPCTPGDFKHLNILYATDFNEEDHHSLESLLKIVDPFDKTVTCIHIDTEHNPAKTERLEELNSQLSEQYGEHHISCQLIEDQDVYHGIKEFAARNQINLLSFTVHKRGIFEKLFRPNLFKKILQESNLPILLFPS